MTGQLAKMLERRRGVGAMTAQPTKALARAGVATLDEALGLAQPTTMRERRRGVGMTGQLVMLERCSLDPQLIAHGDPLGIATVEALP